MKRFIPFAVGVALTFSLAGCGGVLVDLDTPKSAELSAQYEFYPDSMNLIRAEMEITPEQADEVFIALAACGLDGEIGTISETDGVYKVRWGLNTLEVTMNSDGTVAEIGDGTDILYPEYRQHNFLLDLDVKTGDVKSGTGDTIGEYAYVSTLKSKLKEITVENFAEFAETVVQDSGYNWFTIKCDDGTGICFPGSMYFVGDYGKIDADGSILESYGTITITETGSFTYEPK